MSKYYSKITKKSVNKFNLGGTPTPSFNISPTNTMNLSVSSTAPTKSFGLYNLGTDYSTNFRNQNVGISNNIGISSSANLLPSTDPLSVGLDSNSVNNLNIETPENNLSLNNNQINPVINEKQNSKIGDWGKVGLEALTGLGGIATGVVDASQIKDTSGYKAEANMIGASGGKGDNYDEALQAYNNIAPGRTITARDLMGSKSDRAKAFLGTSLKGLSTGAGIGGTIGGFAGGVGALPGMAIGGAIGLLVGSASAGIGNLVNRVRANRAVKDVNREYQEQRALAIRNQNNKFGNIYNNNNFNALTNSYNMAADGGFIDNYFNMSYNNKFADGGFLSSNGTDFNTGYRYIGNGGTHDENPNEGIQIGVDPQGIPNMVEEGEVIAKKDLTGTKDYVFGKTKLKASGGFLDESKLPSKYAGMPYSDIFLDLAKEYNEKPNDPITKNTIKANTQKLIRAQEKEREQDRAFDMQGAIMADKILGTNLTQEQMSQENNDQQQMGLKGLMAYGGYTKNIFIPTGNSSNYIITPKDYNLEPRNFNYPYSPKNRDAIAAENQRILGNINFNTPGLNVSPSMQPSTSPLTMEEEKNIVSRGRETQKKQPDPYEVDYLPTTPLRHMSLLGPAIGLGMSLKPADYSIPKDLELKMANNGDFTRVKPSSVGNYLKAKYMDRNYIGTKIGQQYANTVDNIRNLSNGNQSSAMAHLAAADAASIINRGDAYMKADQYNWDIDKDVENFNRDTNRMNAEWAQQAATTNATLEAQAKQRELSLASEAAKYRYLIDKDRSTAIGANLTNFFDNVGRLGKENYAMNQQKWLEGTGYYGPIGLKPQGVSDAEWEKMKEWQKQRDRYTNSLNNPIETKEEKQAKKVEEFKKLTDKKDQKIFKKELIDSIDNDKSLYAFEKAELKAYYKKHGVLN